MVTPVPVNMLEAFRGSKIEGDRLLYPRLPELAAKAYETERALWDALPGTEAGSMEEAYVLNNVQIGRLVLTAHQLSEMSPHDDRRQALSDKFTALSQELYGTPDPEYAAGIARGYIATYENYVADPEVSEEHLQVVLGHFDDQLSETSLGHQPLPDIRTNMPELGTALAAMFRDPLHVFEDTKDQKEPVDADEILRLYAEANSILADQNPIWGDASVVLAEGSSMSSDSRSLQVKIGRKGNYSGQRVFGLYIHENLIHLQKALNGRVRGSEPLRYGTPGYLAAEEGQALYFDAATGTRIGEQYQDYYLNIAMALGDFGRSPMKRIEFEKYYTSKLIVAQQLRGARPDTREQAHKKALRHAKRIYRGTLGNDVTGINTRDSSYQRGLQDVIAPYIDRQITIGESPRAIISYMLQGKFDPTKQLDRQHVASLH